MEIVTYKGNPPCNPKPFLKWTWNEAESDELMSTVELILLSDVYTWKNVRSTMIRTLVESFLKKYENKLYLAAGNFTLLCFIFISYVTLTDTAVAFERTGLKREEIKVKRGSAIKALNTGVAFSRWIDSGSVPKELVFCWNGPN